MVTDNVLVVFGMDGALAVMLFGDNTLSVCDDYQHVQIVIRLLKIMYLLYCYIKKCVEYFPECFTLMELIF